MRPKPPMLLLPVISLAVLLAQSLLWGQVGGEPKDESSGSVRVSYGSATASPGLPVEVPLYLTTPDVVGVGSVESELRFPKEVLEFVRARKSNILESAEQVGLETEVQDDPKENSRLVLKLNLKNAQSEKKPLPSGLLAFVTFKVSPNAKPGDLKLDHRVTARDAGPDAKPIPNTVAEAPVLSVYPKGMNPLLTCFFFTH